MKQPLRIFSALTFTAVLCAAQGGAVSTPGSPAVPAQNNAQNPETGKVASEAGKAVSEKDVPMSEQTRPNSGSPASPAGLEEGPASGAPTASPGKPSIKPYVIGALDILDIRVWNNPNVGGVFDVRPDGMISMPLVGEINADGLTVVGLRDIVKERLSGFLNSPEVNIQVLRILSKRYFVFGGVNHPGEFPLTGEIRLLDAFANCSGFKDFANTKKIYVLRGDKKFMFNYKDVSHGKHMEQNIVVQNGDRVFVPE
jgi:polysaccharide export outer membrane protein